MADHLRRGDLRRAELELELEALYAKMRRIPYVDPIDVRYRRFEAEPKPITRAVMFCLMDVSGSMSEHMKDLAKRFYLLLYVFLTRRYREVDIVFVRHTDRAEEVDEDTFFRSPASGGTLVFSTEPLDGLVPPGAEIIDTPSDAEADVLRTPVPSGTLTIDAGCTSYPGYGMSSPNFTWAFPRCTTSTRTCAAVQGGKGTFA